MNTVTRTALTVGTRRINLGNGQHAYTGVLRHNGRIVVECGHQHTNRDVTSGINGRSASDCARDVLAGARNDHTARHNAQTMRNGWLKLTRGGFVTSKTTIDKAKMHAAQRADAYGSAVAATRAFLAAHPDTTTTVVAPDEPQRIGDMPDWMLGLGS